jgi:dolichol-phosphate mannosyltransferase
MLERVGDRDIVIGSRFIDGGEIEGRSFWRDLLSIVANRFIRFITGKKIRDWTSGLRVYKREIWESTMPKVECIKWDFQFEALYKSILDGYKVEEVPITFHERAGGASKFNLGEAFYFVFSIFKILLTT